MKMRKINFAIETYGQDLVEANEKDSFGPQVPYSERSGPMGKGLVVADGEITQKGWKQLNVDLVKVERNTMEWLNKMFQRAEDHGHAADETLVGWLWYDPKDETQAEIVALGAEGILLEDLSYGKTHNFAFKGTSRFSIVLGGRLFIGEDEEAG